MPPSNGLWPNGEPQSVRDTWDTQQGTGPGGQDTQAGAEREAG